MPKVDLGGVPAPLDGKLPPSALIDNLESPWAAYVHVPFCSVRCGYCDFNTYTATELGPGVDRSSYAATVALEVDLAQRVMGERGPLATVFFGGGTPTLLPAADLGAIVTSLRERFGLAQDAEVTTEANPDSVTPSSLAQLREAGFNRISFGMQSAVPEVLATLDRTHDPAGVPKAVQWAREAGFEQVSLDLIYGTPGESESDWQRSLDAALACEPNHLSAYSLIIEDGTALARRVRRGEIPMPEGDVLADRYEQADRAVQRAGLDWYEVSNWAAGEDAQCRHNLLYWRSADWWGFGPGAHSHVGGVRWWNLKHPVPYAERLRSNASPAQGREVLSDSERHFERVLLEVRLRSGLDVGLAEEAAVHQVVADGLGEVIEGRLVLTDRGRLLADRVVHELVA